MQTIVKHPFQNRRRGHLSFFTGFAYIHFMARPVLALFALALTLLLADCSKRANEGGFTTEPEVQIDLVQINLYYRA